MPLLLRYTEPGSTRRRLRRLPDYLQVGRSAAPGSLWLDSPTVAPLHAEIDARVPDDPVVRLLAPEGALFVNGTLVHEAHLKPGDQLFFGDVPVHVVESHPSPAALLPSRNAPVDPAVATLEGQKSMRLLTLVTAILALGAGTILMSPPGRMYLQKRRLEAEREDAARQWAAKRFVENLRSQAQKADRQAAGAPTPRGGTELAAAPPTPAYFTKEEKAPASDLPGRLDRALDGTVAIVGTSLDGFRTIGSGIIVSSRGHVLTNRHVISRADFKIEVRLRNGHLFRAELLRNSENRDLAILTLQGNDTFQTLPFARTEDIKVGMVVYAIGSPISEDLSFSVTRGIISSSRRAIGTQWYLQHDAAINPGNSGGALVDEAGRVLGINTWKVVGLETQGLGFAIPSEEVVAFLQKALAK